MAIGDIHGAYDNLVAVLEVTHLVNQNLEWCGGKTHFGPNGEMVDRGPDSRKVMDLFMRLEIACATLQVVADDRWRHPHLLRQGVLHHS